MTRQAIRHAVQQMTESTMSLDLSSSMYSLTPSPSKFKRVQSLQPAEKQKHSRAAKSKKNFGRHGSSSKRRHSRVAIQDLSAIAPLRVGSRVVNSCNNIAASPLNSTMRPITNSTMVDLARVITTSCREILDLGSSDTSSSSTSAPDDVHGNNKTDNVSHQPLPDCCSSGSRSTKTYPGLSDPHFSVVSSIGDQLGPGTTPEKRTPCDGQEDGCASDPEDGHIKAISLDTSLDILDIEGNKPQQNSRQTRACDFSVNSDATAFMDIPLCRKGIAAEGYASPAFRKRVARKLKQFSRICRSSKRHSQIRTLAVL